MTTREGAAPAKSDPKLSIPNQHSNYHTDRAFWTTVWCYFGSLSVAQIVVSVWMAVQS